MLKEQLMAKSETDVAKEMDALQTVIDAVSQFDEKTRMRIWAATRAFFGEGYVVTRGETPRVGGGGK